MYPEVDLVVFVDWDDSFFEDGLGCISEPFFVEDDSILDPSHPFFESSERQHTLADFLDKKSRVHLSWPIEEKSLLFSGLPEDSSASFDSSLASEDSSASFDISFENDSDDFFDPFFEDDPLLDSPYPFFDFDSSKKSAPMPQGETSFATNSSFFDSDPRKRCSYAYGGTSSATNSSSFFPAPTVPQDIANQPYGPISEAVLKSIQYPYTTR